MFFFVLALILKSSYTINSVKLYVIKLIYLLKSIRLKKTPNMHEACVKT